MKEEKNKGQQGYCANCGSSELDYTDTHNEEKSVGYEFECQDCKKWGIEWNNIEYCETIVK